MTTAASILDPYDSAADAETFDVERWLLSFPVEMWDEPEVRRAATELDPLLFAVIYLRHHVTSAETGGFSVADFHLELVRWARGWAIQTARPAQYRDAWIAPRSAGKSTWLFLILIMWAAAHRHRTFVAAFANSAQQAEQHLATFKNELDRNELLRNDFPDLCESATRPTGAKMADRVDLIQQVNGFIFAAKGIDAGTLGMKVGETRPNLILADDMEPDEKSYSTDLAEKRLGTLLDAILPLNVFARVCLVGTTVMAGSIMHQLVRRALEPNGEHPEWIDSENFQIHYAPPIVVRDDGSERSCWPAKWPLDFLVSIRHTRSFKKNYENRPISADGDYWGPEDFTYADLPTISDVLSIDPATTSKSTSDPYGIAVVGLHSTTSANPRNLTPRDFAHLAKRCAVVKYATAVRLSPAKLRDHVLKLLDDYPQIGEILVETNQGGELWLTMLHNLPVRVRTIHQTEPKNLRASNTLARYQRGEVVHTHPLGDCETEMMSYPKGLHDDMVDAVGTAVRHILGTSAAKKNRISLKVVGYV